MTPEFYNPAPAPHRSVILSGGRVWYLDSGSPIRLGNCLGCVDSDCAGCSKRLGAGSAAVEESGRAIQSAAAVAGPFAPIVAGVGELVSIIGEFFGGGCGAACTQSATLEQVPEVALDDMQAVSQQQPGAISAAMFQEAYNAILNYGVQQLQALQAKGDSRAAGGITNLEKSTDQYKAYIATLPANATVALDVTAAQQVFTDPAAKGWEPGSVAAGNSLALQVLQSIASAGSSSASTVTGIEAATGLSGTTLLLIAGALAYTLIER
ncbi:MAG TPA: hypothetical protein VMQ76_05905 [Terracidiphilus sp.]|jgi:hypothetical protein|nr:hypothetical protein [Terracidiphilus sp.]